MTTCIQILTAIGSVATAGGVAVACWQISLSYRQSRTRFEDELARQYRQIARAIPVEALLGDELANDKYDKALGDFYHYIDLSNEQVFLRQNDRISKATWQNWVDGIRSHLSRPAFKKAWEEIGNKAGDSFEELRRLEKERFAVDPRKWRGAST